MMVDDFSLVAITRAISPTRVANDTPLVSEVIDIGKYRSLLFAISTGTLADADATFAALVEYSEDGVTFEACPDDYLIGTESGASFTFADDDETRKIGYIGPRRYVRLTITPTNNGGNADIAAVAIQGRPYRS